MRFRGIQGFPIYRSDIFQEPLFQLDCYDVLAILPRHGSRPRLTRALPFLRLLLGCRIARALIAALSADDVRGFGAALIRPLSREHRTA